MDFMNRGAQPSSARTTPSANSPSENSGRKKVSNWSVIPTWIRATWLILLFAGTILVVGIIGLLLLSSRNEGEIVDKDKYQAVFLDNNQVYFGKIKSINNSYVDLQGIYYLNVSQPVQPKQSNTEQQGNITLQKLGCELHGPVDQMVINREQIVFWENLKDDGQVSQAIAKWLEQNPNGPNCNQTSTQEGNNSESKNEESTDTSENNE